MDKLDQIFVLQGQLIKRLKVQRSVETLRMLFVALTVEMAEWMQEINWKPWKQQPKVEHRAKILEELADVLHFYIEICILQGFSAEDLFKAYEAKMKVNHARQDVKY